MERFHSEIIYWSIMCVVFIFMRNSATTCAVFISIAGLFFAARFLREIHSSTNSIHYFMIPATQIEKLTVSLLFTIVYFYIMMLIAFILGNLVGTGLNNLLASLDFPFFSLFKHRELSWSLFEGTAPAAHGTVTSCFAWRFFRLFIIVQSIFTLGGIWFKRNQSFKTIFALIISAFAIFIVLLLELKIITGTTSFVVNNSTVNHGKASVFFTDLTNILDYFFWLLPPFLWLTSYFRLTEKEV
jgi:hypothetical protein